MLEQKIIEENIENNLVFPIDSRKKEMSSNQQKENKNIFRNPSHLYEQNMSTFYFSIYDFGLFIKTITKEPLYRKISREKAGLDCNF